jgi:hypothetical protein
MELFKMDIFFVLIVIFDLISTSLGQQKPDTRLVGVGKTVAEVNAAAMKLN